MYFSFRHPAIVYFIIVDRKYINANHIGIPTLMPTAWLEENLLPHYNQALKKTAENQVPC